MENIFYIYGVFKIIRIIIGLFKKKKDDDVLDVDCSDPSAIIKTWSIKIDFNFFMRILDAIWFILGLWTLESRFFLLMILFAVVIPILTMLGDDKNKNAIKHIHVVSGIFDVMVIVSVLAHHYLNL